MKARLLALALAAAVASPVTLTVPEAVQAAPATAAQPDPAAQVAEWAQHFRRSDVAALAQALVPPSRWEELRIVYDVHRKETASESERARFAEAVERFTAPDAVDRLMEEFEPKLAEARPRAPAAMLMAFGAAQMALASDDSELSAEQRDLLQKVLPGVQEWAMRTDFLSSDTLRLALTLVTDAARQAGIDDIDQLRALPLERALDRAGPLLGAAKDAVRLYGIDLDAIAASLKVEVVSVDAERARVRSTVTVFGAPLWTEHDLVLIEGRWYGEDTVRHVQVSMHHGASAD